MSEEREKFLNNELSLGLEIRLFVEVAEEVEEDGLLGLDEGVVALIELLFYGFVVSVRGNREHLSPEAVVLAVREAEDVVGTCKNIQTRKLRLPAIPKTL